MGVGGGGGRDHGLSAPPAGRLSSTESAGTLAPKGPPWVGGRGGGQGRCCCFVLSFVELSTLKTTHLYNFAQPGI